MPICKAAVLRLASIELIFFISAYRHSFFRFVTKTELTMH